MEWEDEESAFAPPYEAGVLTEFVTTSSGVRMPRLIYTVTCNDEAVVMSAVSAGFRALNFAAGFREESGELRDPCGAALSSLFASGVSRDSLFIQTTLDLKQAAELNKGVPITKLLELAIANLLARLRLEYIDSVVLASPYEYDQLLQAWTAMEGTMRDGHARQLGISEVVSLQHLQKLCADASVKPAVVQQQLHTGTGFESETRAWCGEAGIHFQAFWMLTANPKFSENEFMQNLARKYQVEPSILLFRFVMGLGIPLAGVLGEQSELDGKMQRLSEALLAWRVPLEVQDAQIMNVLLSKQIATDQRGVREQAALLQVTPVQGVSNVLPGMEDYEQLYFRLGGVLGDVAVLIPSESQQKRYDRYRSTEEGLGFVVWPSGHALASLLSEEPELVAGKRVLEVGCGLGLPATAAAAAGAELVVCADSDGIAAETAACSARLAAAPQTNVLKGARLDWHQPKTWPVDFDVVLAADILYKIEFPLSVAATLAAVLSKEGTALIADPVDRPFRVEFAQACRKHGLRYTEAAMPGRRDWSDAIVLLTVERRA
eukprot:gnl/TRDRNA2_/TRDRNA2_156771_c1_seq2.p1 gnl/TRDRNA2_/TRDRNA2_156771_c1~~gnl/TRDRNA2_/TRDRNA2_156771_c1_seq2.p1  ORF type:complete len:617 (+),score=99.70 gnl/TRDRNA2_/TRDRNA2_156771_c1_seq2:211-1851(+)